MTAAPSVSCIVPVFNGERFLGEALDSILTQGGPPVEVIVVDDGSADGTTAVLSRYARRIRVERQNNRGPAAARNAGLRVATSPFLAFLDADDLWLEGKLTQQLAVLVARPSLGFCLSGIENFWEPELGEIPEAVRNSPASGPRPGYYLQTMLAHRGVFETVGFLDESLRNGEDLDWFVRAAEKQVQFEILPPVLVRRRIHGANLTGLGGGNPRLHLAILRESIQRRRGTTTQPNQPRP